MGRKAAKNQGKIAMITDIKISNKKKYLLLMI